MTLAMTHNMYSPQYDTAERMEMEMEMEKNSNTPFLHLKTLFQPKRQKDAVLKYLEAMLNSRKPNLQAYSNPGLLDFLLLHTRNLLVY